MADPEYLAQQAMLQRQKSDVGDTAKAEVLARANKTGIYAVQDNSAQYTGDVKTRDDDGTVDRVRDPPPELLPVLASIKEKAKVERVDLSSIFAEQGANQFGIMATTRFIGSLTVNFPRFRIEEKIYLALVDAYGIGFKTPMGGWESIAWMDFCEDVDKAVDTTEGQVATRLAHSRSASLTFENLQKAPEDLVDL